MQKQIEQISEAMRKGRQETPDKPIVPTVDVRILRVRLIAEELLELSYACGLSLQIRDGMVSVCRESSIYDMKEAYDAVIDLKYVGDGAAIAFGFSSCYEEGFNEVHRNNLSRIETATFDAFGKWVKNPNHPAPNLEPILFRAIGEPL